MKDALVRWRAARLLGVLSLFAWAPGNAHHSFNFFFDSTRTMTVEGVVSEVYFQNPHVRFDMEVVNEDGETETWAIETNHRAGIYREVAVGDPWLPDTLQPGDRVIAEGYPAKEEGRTALHGLALERPSDGWRWVWRLNLLSEERQTEFQEK